MSENEKLARWLPIPGAVFKDGKVFLADPDLFGKFAPIEFRQSNEWAGSLQEKLLPFIKTLSPSGRRCRIELHLWNPRKGMEFTVVIGKSWRDAVCDAALAVIEREASNG